MERRRVRRPGRACLWDDRNGRDDSARNVSRKEIMNEEEKDQDCPFCMINDEMKHLR